MKLHEVNYPDGSKFSVNADKKGNVYMNIYEGDVRDKKHRQITTAVADGTIALLNAERYIAEIKKN